jgi:hypothetical protein
MEKRWIVKLSQEECKLKAEISFALFFRKLGCI